MLTNFHTHTVFCDGKNTPEEMVLSAIEKGFSSLGFSGHGYTKRDLLSCMKDTEGYIREITALKEKYKGKIQIYLGIEEDASSLTDRSRFDYIIGSWHFLKKDERYFPFDVSYENYLECLNAFNSDPIEMAHAYYAPFCKYINERRPDIVGHFDLITKFDEKDIGIFLGNKKYEAVAEEYLGFVVGSGCLFEVNTGAMSRGIRTNPYPAEDLLHILKKEKCGIVLSSDSHRIETIDFAFRETRYWLKDLGFSYVYTLYDGEFIKDYL